MKIPLTVVPLVLLMAILGWLMNQPKNVGPDVPQGKLNSLSFAPFWEGQGPMEGNFPTVPQLDSDLRLLGGKTHSIRTYASAEGSLPEIPALARKYGLTMIQGAWLGGIKKTNQLEIDGLIRSANANPDVVKRVIVGNEVLLRGDLGADELVQYIRAVKQAVKQPVSYADVWSVYLKYPQLMKEVDFITVHILPYWEDEPIAVEQAPAHIGRIYSRVQQEAQRLGQDKPILIGESGWPSEGRQRGQAIPSVVNEAEFIRGLIEVANANHFDYNIVEAINQPWKSELEGVVGANWGLFSSVREEVFPLTGPVYENPRWYWTWGAAIGIWLVWVGVLWKPLKALPILPLAALLGFAQILALLWVNQTEWLWYTSYTLWQRLATVSLVGLDAVLAGLILQSGYTLLARQAVKQKLADGLYLLYGVFGVYAFYKTVWLAVSGRYVSFPILSLSIPVIGLLGLLLILYTSGRQWPLAIWKVLAVGKRQLVLEKWLGYALLATGVGLIVGETLAFWQSGDLLLAYPEAGKRLLVSLRFTLTNQQLLQWLGCLWVLSLPLVWGGRTPPAERA